LASVHSDEATDYIISESGTACWIGLDDIATEGSWVWKDGTTLDYENWADGEPSGGNENCAAFWHQPKWNDDNCENSNCYTCGL
jgi:hypothetical protein